MGVDCQSATSLMRPECGGVVHIAQSERPRLLVFVDAEEEFDWRHFSSTAYGLRNLAQQIKAQRIFDSFGCRPTYMVDYPVAAQPEGRELLREFLEAGRCNIGAQLHPWVNPPIEREVVDQRESFAGNLPRALEYAKLAELSRVIEAGFGRRPTIYRAGRYGIGPNTASILMELGYRIDTSVLPGVNFSHCGGPDFRGFDVLPYWVNRQAGLLELPICSNFIGRISRFSDKLHPLITSPYAKKMRLPAVFARLGALNQVRLSPEGQRLDEAIDLTRHLLAHGIRVFVLTYHSSSLLPGSTSYVRSEADLQQFLNWLSCYLDFFFNEVGGQASTPDEVYSMALAADKR